MKLKILVLSLMVCTAVGAMEMEGADPAPRRIAPVSTSALASLAGGIGGGIVGAVFGLGVEMSYGSTCSGSDFCIPAGPIAGLTIGYGIGSTWALYGMQNHYHTETRFSRALMWTALGMGLGVAGAAAASGSPLAATGLFLGLSHVFPAVMMSF